MRRREFLTAAATVAVVQAQDPKAIVVDSRPLFEISPLLYMQFMEPLGTTDSAVEASWDYNADDWRGDFVAITRDLAPGAIRFGGLFSRYYRWREGVGPVRGVRRCAITSGAAKRRIAWARMSSSISAGAPERSRSTASVS